MRGIIVVTLLICIVALAGAAQAKDLPKQISQVDAGIWIPEGWEPVSADIGWTVGVTHLDRERKYCAVLDYAQFNVSLNVRYGYQQVYGSGTHRLVSGLVGPALCSKDGYLALLAGVSNDQASATAFAGGYGASASASKTDFVLGIAGGVTRDRLGIQARYQWANDAPFRGARVAATLRF